jgi:hypothetical protein
MTLRREQVVSALAAVVQSFAQCPVEIDAEDIDRHTDGDGYLHGCLVDSGTFKVTLDGGPDCAWEGERSCAVEYQVLGADQERRRAVRDAFSEQLIAVLAQDPTLGLDPQVFARIAEGGGEHDIPIDDVSAMSVCSVNVAILYVASSALG